MASTCFLMSSKILLFSIVVRTSSRESRPVAPLIYSVSNVSYWMGYVIFLVNLRINAQMMKKSRMLQAMIIHTSISNWLAIFCWRSISGGGSFCNIKITNNADSMFADTFAVFGLTLLVTRYDIVSLYGSPLSIVTIVTNCAIPSTTYEVLKDPLCIPRVRFPRLVSFTYINSVIIDWLLANVVFEDSFDKIILLRE